MWKISLLLAVAAVVLAMLFLRTRDRRYLWGLAGIVAGFALLGLIALFRGESDSDQMKRKIEAMAGEVQAKNSAGINAHISDSFRLGSVDRAALRALAEREFERGELSELRVWNIQPAAIAPAGDGKPATATVEFNVKPIGPEGAGQLFWRVAATFVKDSDGQWRLQGFKLFWPNQSDEFHIPQLPN